LSSLSLSLFLLPRWAVANERIVEAALKEEWKLAQLKEKAAAAATMTMTMAGTDVQRFLGQDGHAHGSIQGGVGTRVNNDNSNNNINTANKMEQEEGGWRTMVLPLSFRVRFRFHQIGRVSQQWPALYFQNLIALVIALVGGGGVPTKKAFDVME
jgi:hypothetical protein